MLYTPIFHKEKISHFYCFTGSNKGRSALFRNRQLFIINILLIVSKLIWTATSSSRELIVDMEKADKLHWTANTQEKGNSPDRLLDPAKPSCYCCPALWQRSSRKEGSSYCWEKNMKQNPLFSPALLSAPVMLSHSHLSFPFLSSPLSPAQNTQLWPFILE